MSAGSATTVHVVPETLRALGDPVRCSIVEHLGTRREVTVSELAALFPITLRAVSKHIKVLEVAGVVTQRRDGRHRPVSLQFEAILNANTWLEHRRRELAERFERLDGLTEEPLARPGAAIRVELPRHAQTPHPCG